MTYNMFIDDERMPHDVTWAARVDQEIYNNGQWIVVRDYDEVVECIMNLGLPSLVSFDHDLGENTPTGYDIAKMMCDLILDGVVLLPEDFRFRVHSKNPVGKKNIEEYMRAFVNYALSEK